MARRLARLASVARSTTDASVDYEGEGDCDRDDVEDAARSNDRTKLAPTKSTKQTTKIPMKQMLTSIQGRAGHRVGGSVRIIS